MNLDYDTEYKMLTYKVPMYENKAKIYMVPRDLMPDGLTAVYGDSGELDKVELAAAEFGNEKLIGREYKKGRVWK